MNARLIHRRIVPPAALGKKPRIIAPLAPDAIRLAVHHATGRWPRNQAEAGQTWRSLEAGGWRIEDVPRPPPQLCLQPLCRALAPFGYKLAGGGPSVWACGEHRPLAEAMVSYGEPKVAIMPEGEPDPGPALCLPDPPQPERREPPTQLGFAL